MGKLLTSGRARWVGRLATFGIAGLVIAAAFGLRGAPAPARAAASEVPGNPLQAIQDLSFTTLGLSDQTVHGPAGSILTYFPAPPAPLAPSGNFVRVFFAHGEPDYPAASLAVI